LRGFFGALGCVIYKGVGCSFMQARRPPRIRCSSVWVLVTLLLSFYILSFTFFFFRPTPNPLPSGKRALSLRSPAFQPPPLSIYIVFKPIHCVGWVISFFFSFIDEGLIKDRAVAMGKPHCNRSICTLLVLHPRPWSTSRGILFLFFLPWLALALALLTHLSNHLN